MKWTSWLGYGVAALSVAGAGTLATMANQSPAVQSDAVVPTDRNCWDRSTWGYDDQRRSAPEVPGCEIPLPDDLPSPAPDGAPRFVSHDLTPNHGHTLSPGTLQVVTFYDGDVTSRPTLRIEYAHPRRGAGWIVVDDIHTSTSNVGRIDTSQFDIADNRLTGRFEIDGIVPNGVIDGLAFGLFWRDVDGFHVLRSTAPDPQQYAALVGTWPIGLNDRSFEKRTPQLTSGHGRQQAKMTLYGAEYLDNGTYLMAIQERAVRMDDRAVAR